MGTAGHEIDFTPPYWPQLQPVELFWYRLCIWMLHGVVVRFRLRSNLKWCWLNEWSAEHRKDKNSVEAFVTKFMGADGGLKMSEVPNSGCCCFFAWVACVVFQVEGWCRKTDRFANAVVARDPAVLTPLVLEVMPAGPAGQGDDGVAGDIEDAVREGFVEDRVVRPLEDA